MSKIDPGKIVTEHVAVHLREISLDKRVAFSLSCAERLFPLYEGFTYQRSAKELHILRDALDSLWDKALAGTVMHRVPDEIISGLLSVGPRGEQLNYRFSDGAVNAVSATIHAYQLCGRDDLEEALWCSVIARRAIEGYLDWTGRPWYKTGYSSAEPARENVAPGGTDWSTHPLFQYEVLKQFTDLRLLSEHILNDTTVSQLRNDGALGIQPLLRGLLR